jgi:hypothetical protein
MDLRGVPGWDRVHMTEFSDLVQKPGERHILYGGTRTGKSSFADWSMRYIQEYRPTAMQLVADTKPRFRAETQAYGPGNRWRKSAQPLYRHWAKGPVVPNSVVVPWGTRRPFRSLWDCDNRPGEIAIMQSDEFSDWRIMLALMNHFVAKKINDRERLLVVDEALDFYQRNTLGIDPRNDCILRTARAGGERNIGLMLGAHRPHGLPPLLNTLSSRVSLFYLKYSRDMKYLWEMGVPESESSPAGNYIFKQYQVAPGGKVSGPLQVRLQLPDSYLKQLAAT